MFKRKSCEFVFRYFRFHSFSGILLFVRKNYHQIPFSLGYIYSAMNHTAWVENELAVLKTNGLVSIRKVCPA